MSDMTEQTQRVGVVGTGVMGRGIIQWLAAAGIEVAFHDAKPGAADAARDAIAAILGRELEKGRATQAEADAAIRRMHPVTSLAGLVGCEVIIEAVFEDLELKRELFRALEAIVSEDAVLATNTSSFLIAEIAAACRRPQRVAGAHFFNPVPRMRVVELISAVRTDAAALQRLVALVRATGHRAVVVEDQPGFLVNHIGRGLYTEGLRLLEERVATVQQIDTLLREAAGFRMGPFELMDLTGLDVSGKVMTSIHAQFQQEPRFRPSSLVPPRIAAGLFGRKTGEGWYRYEQGHRVDAAESPPPAVDPSIPVWVDPNAEHAEALRARFVAAGARLLDTPGDDALLVLQPWGCDATQACLAAGLDPARSVAVDPLVSMEGRQTLMLTVATRPAYRDAAQALLAAGGPVTLVGDSPGFVVQRVLATIVNIAAELAQRGIAPVPDIEDAIRLGLGYPHGPLGWGDRIGAARILQILDAMLAATGDPRYRASPWLRRRAMAGISLLTPDPAGALR